VLIFLTISTIRPAPFRLCSSLCSSSPNVRFSAHPDSDSVGSPSLNDSIPPASPRLRQRSLRASVDQRPLSGTWMLGVLWPNFGLRCARSDSLSSRRQRRLGDPTNASRSERSMSTRRKTLL
jgi:hypothetical protein